MLFRSPFLPAAYDTGSSDSIHPVMSIDAAGTQSDFSNSADIGALGERLIGVGPNDEWVYWSGSSFATAFLTARSVLDGSIPPGTRFTTPDHVLTEPTTPPPTTTPNTSVSTTPGSAVTTTTRPPTSSTTTTLAG